MIDMTNNRVPYGLMTDEERAALEYHQKMGGEFVVAGYGGRNWPKEMVDFQNHCVYRTVPLPKTQDVIAWDRLPDWVEWVARDMGGEVFCFTTEPDLEYEHWQGTVGKDRRIDDFPGIVQVGTCDWKDSKQRTPPRHAGRD